MDSRASKTPIQLTYIENFEAPVGQVWDYVANSQRFLASSGAPWIVFENRSKLTGVVQGRFFRHPFQEKWPQWERDSFLIRELVFDSRILDSVELRFEFKESNTGCAVKIEVFITPKNILGLALLSPWVRLRLQPGIQKASNRLQAFFKHEAPSAFYPLSEQPDLNEKNAEQIRALIARTPLTETEQKKVADFFTYAFPEDLARIRLRYLAYWMRLDEKRLIEAFLFLSRDGFLKMEWRCYCPYCGSEQFHADSPSAFAGRIHCDCCGNSSEIYLDVHTEVTFRVNRFRELSETDLSHPLDTQALPGRAAQWALPGSSRRNVSFEMPDTAMILTAPEKKWQCVLQPSSDESEQHEIRLEVSKASSGQVCKVSTGETLRLTLVNPESSDCTVTLNQARRSPYLMRASKILLNGRFRKEFGNELNLKANEMMQVRRAALMKTCLNPKINPSPDLIQSWKEAVSALVTKAGGVIVYSGAKEYTLIFPDQVSALSAGLALLSDPAAGEFSVSALSYGKVILSQIGDQLEVISNELEKLDDALQHSAPKNLTLTLPMAQAPGIKPIIQDLDLQITRVRKKDDPMMQFFRLGSAK